jgi:hypothetical protein
MIEVNSAWPSTQGEGNERLGEGSGYESSTTTSSCTVVDPGGFVSAVGIAGIRIILVSITVFLISMI